MTEKNNPKQVIEAIDFEVPGSQATSQAAKVNDQGHQSKQPWWHSQFNLMLCVFALLFFSAALVCLANTSARRNE